MDYELLFLKSLVLTIGIETVVLILFFRWIVKLKETGICRLLITGIMASFATLPYLWFVFPDYIDSKLWYIIICESFAVLVEAIIIGAVLRTKCIQSLWCSFLCNATSFLTGLLIF